MGHALAVARQLADNSSRRHVFCFRIPRPDANQRMERDDAKFSIDRHADAGSAASR